MALDYPSHLKLSQLLNLQETVSDSEKTQEVFFILIHQVHELLFKMLLRELDSIKNEFLNNNISQAIVKWKRCCLILKTSISQFETLDTLSPGEFNEFRAALGEASGMQSYQFREIEFVLGYKRSNLLESYLNNEVGYNALLTRLNSRSIIDEFYHLLKNHGATVDVGLLERDLTLPSILNENIQKCIINFTANHVNLALLFDAMLDFDIVFSEWRFKHWKTVERMIGTKIGTGGTVKSQRLHAGSHETFFPDLWAVRNRL